MYVGQELAQADKNTLHGEIDLTIEYLGKCDIVTAPEFIHIAKQVDFVECEGRRIVENVFPVDRMNAFSTVISAQVGKQLNIGDDNKATVLRHGSLRPLITLGSTMVKRLLPSRISRRLRNHAREILIQPARERLPPAFHSKSILDFIEEYYADDIVLHNAALSNLETGSSSRRPLG
jgi:hypothetical protein